MNITLGFLPSLMLWRAWRIGTCARDNPSCFPKDMFYIKYTPDIEFDLVKTNLDTIPSINIPRGSRISWSLLIGEIKQTLKNLLYEFELEGDVCAHAKKNSLYNACAMEYFNQYTRFHQTTAYLRPIVLTYDFECKLPIFVPTSQRGSYSSMGNAVSPIFVSHSIKAGWLYELIFRHHILSDYITSNDHIYVLSPEYLLAYAAKFLICVSKNHIYRNTIQTHNLLRLMCELAGTYGYDPLFGTETIYKLEPLCNTQSLKKFCSDYYVSPRQALYTKTALHVLDGLASPFETVVALALTLPEKYGGIHLGVPSINQTRVLENQKAGTTHHYLTPDIYFNKYHLAIECNGEVFHNTKEGFLEDQRRIRDYATLGDTHMPVVYKDIHTTQDLQKLLLAIVNACLQKNKNLRYPSYVARIEQANKNYQQEILLKILG